MSGDRLTLLSLGVTPWIQLEASLTGHLVLSSLHTNDAPSAFTRLLDMGIEPYLVASSLEAVLAQRLIRRIPYYQAMDLILTGRPVDAVGREPDGDGDGACDGVDNCLGLYNPDQDDFDGDDVGGGVRTRARGGERARRAANHLSRAATR